MASALAGGAVVDDAAEQAAAEAEPQADLNASVEYRVHLAKVLTRRALERRRRLTRPEFRTVLVTGGRNRTGIGLEQRLVGAAVDVDLGAGEELACSLHRNATMAPKSSGSPMRMAVDGVAVELRHPVGGVQAGLHRVDRDAVAGDLAGEGLEEAGGAGPGRVGQDQRRRSAGAPRAT